MCVCGGGGGVCLSEWTVSEKKVGLGLSDAVLVLEVWSGFYKVQISSSGSSQQRFVFMKSRRCRTDRVRGLKRSSLISLTWQILQNFLWIQFRLNLDVRMDDLQNV